MVNLLHGPAIMRDSTHLMYPLVRQDASSKSQTMLSLQFLEPLLSGFSISAPVCMTGLGWENSREFHKSLSAFLSPYIQAASCFILKMK